MKEHKPLFRLIRRALGLDSECIYHYSCKLRNGNPADTLCSYCRELDNLKEQFDDVVKERDHLLYEVVGWAFENARLTDALNAIQKELNKLKENNNES